ncbi:MAG: hypothetical protein IPP22_10545 [Nitrosomonas sp.]|nr:hypothetical protein [Nitrosomonas sp.]
MAMLKRWRFIEHPIRKRKINYRSGFILSMSRTGWITEKTLQHGHGTCIEEKEKREEEHREYERVISEDQEQN